MSIFNTTKVDHLKQPMFLGEPVNIARYDTVKYNQFEKLTDKALGFFWRPQEVELSKDSKDFKKLPYEQQQIFTLPLARNIVLDSVQGRGPSEAFASICSLPEIEVWLKTWEFFETIHSRSYTHIIRNIYPDPSVVFDTITEIQEIVDCAKDITKEYDELISLIGQKDWREPLELKEQIWRTLNAINALEGIRFYASFAIFWAFAEQGLMTGNANIIKLICRDENLHLAGTQQMLKLLVKEDEDFARIAVEEADYVASMFKDVVDQEKAWAKYVFSRGSIIGLNQEILCLYIDHIAAKRAQAIGIQGFKQIPNPLPWTMKWIGGSEVQVAPQESEIVSYRTTGVKNTMTKESFKGYKL
ncbi:ribonucleotide reductase of class Ia (aerobic), beta subunit [Caulobacter phage Cr30]|uniref:ribonucleotide reductase of class Ia (aerobic), beta subunit n=1 Tax=Caulobacter phage Cr30 TaxID=1357714 RepID=UPI0004A9B903|nr:ribonucleotide reductase of class Ia (aerobic), beta subunit [Caulobacter phage Cr30]AGS80932.1 ribonucleotide reductase of class Ia (aerobic), beta subunit [Caulobacter phage Cr30]